MPSSSRHLNLKSSISQKPKSRIFSSQNSRSHSELRASRTPTKMIIENFFIDLDEILQTSRIIPSRVLNKLEGMKTLIHAYQSVANNQYSRLLGHMLKVIDILENNYEFPYSIDSQIRFIANSVNNKSQKTANSADYEKARAFFLRSLSEITAKKLLVHSIQTLKNVNRPSKQEIMLIESFLTLFCKVDNTIDVNLGFKVMKARVWQAFISYLAKPGQVIQTIRKFPDFINTKKIDYKSIRVSREIFSKVTEKPFPFIYGFVEACF